MSSLKTIVVLALLCAVAWAAYSLGARGGRAPDSAPSGAQSTLWYCSMHPHIRQPGPGRCPICDMDLIPMPPAGVDPGPRALSLSQAAARLAEIETAPVERRFVEATVPMVGKVAFDETQVRTITAWVAGRLDRLYVDYEGIAIRKGDHVVDIYSPELFAAQQELLEAAKAVARLEASASEYARRSTLGTLSAVREKLRLAGLTPDQVQEIEARGTPSDHVLIRAPIGGVVVEKRANEGDWVSRGMPIYRIAELGRLWVELEAYESDLPWLRYGQDVEFRVEAYPGRVFAGKVHFIDWVVDPRTRTVRVRMNVANDEGLLKPGMFVSALARSTLASGGRVLSPDLAGKWVSPMHPEIVKDGPGSCDICGMALVPAEDLFASRSGPIAEPLVIPVTAPLITGRRAVVYVRRAAVDGEVGRVYEGREVVLGPRAGSHYLVESGLREGEEVVVRGAFKIDSALQIRAKPSMMSPADGAGAPAAGDEEAHAPTRVVAPEAFRRALEGVYDGYFAVVEALAGDDLAATREAASRLVSALDALPAAELEGEVLTTWLEVGPALRSALDAVLRGEDIVAARAGFQALSGAVAHTEAHFGHGEGAFYEAFCPMAFDDQGAAWLQRTEAIANPYFGKSMLRCGTIRATREPWSPPTPEGGGDADEAPDGSEGASEPPREEGARLFREALEPVYAAYFEMSQALAADDLAMATRAAKALGVALDSVRADTLDADTRAEWEAMVTALRGALSAVASASELGAARVAFEALSVATARVESRFGHGEGAFYEAFCPMAFDDQGATWLQRTETIANPYFGKSMLRCGTIRSTREPRPLGGGDSDGGSSDAPVSAAEGARDE